MFGGSESAPFRTLRPPDRLRVGWGATSVNAHHFDQLMDARVVEGIMQTGDPDTLDPNQLDLDRELLHRTPKPQLARAWVRHGDHAVEIDVEVVAWKSRAIAIRWPGPGGAEHHGWFWTGAGGQRRPRAGAGATPGHVCRRPRPTSVQAQQGWRTVLQWPQVRPPLSRALRPSECELDR